MNDKLDLFDGRVVCTTFPLFVAALGVIFLIWSYYYFCLKKGFKIDVWHFAMFFFGIPFFLVYPFAASDYNDAAVGEHRMLTVSLFVDDAFWVGMLGFAAMYGGFFFYNICSAQFRNVDFMRGLAEWLSRPVEHVLSNRQAINVAATVVAILEILVLVLMIGMYGMSFNMRMYALGDPSIRPIFNAVYGSAMSYILTWLTLSWFRWRRKSSLVFLLLVAIPGFFAGNRAPLLLPILEAMILYWVSQRMKLRIWKVFFWGMVAVVLMLGIEQMRSSESAVTEIETGDVVVDTFQNIVYGNTFSDLRDFGWLLSGWDGKYLYGNTYFAGMMSFVPRSLSEFRDQWGWAMFANRIAGLPENEHGGLRPGLFGEMFFNFGYPGVVVLGIIAGYMLRMYDVRTKEIATQEDGDCTRMYAFGAFYNTVISFFYISSDAYVSYVFWLMILGMMILARMVRSTR